MWGSYHPPSDEIESALAITVPAGMDWPDARASASFYKARASTVRAIRRVLSLVFLVPLLMVATSAFRRTRMTQEGGCGEWAPADALRCWQGGQPPALAIMASMGKRAASPLLDHHTGLVAAKAFALRGRDDMRDAGMETATTVNDLTGNGDGGDALYHEWAAGRVGVCSISTSMPLRTPEEVAAPSSAAWHVTAAAAPEPPLELASPRRRVAEALAAAFTAVADPPDLHDRRIRLLLDRIARLDRQFDEAASARRGCGGGGGRRRPPVLTPS